MEIDRAKEILRSLADGRDPATGEQFPPNSPYQQAETVRALFMAVDALDNAARRARRQANRPEEAPAHPTDPNRPQNGMPRRSGDSAKAGASWSPEEEQQLHDAFAARKPIAEIASAHGRTQGAITARLVKLGLIDAPATNRAGQPPRPIRPSPSPRPQPQMPRELTEQEKNDLPF